MAASSQQPFYGDDGFYAAINGSLAHL